MAKKNKKAVAPTMKNPKGKKVTREVEIDLDQSIKLKLADELTEKSRALSKLKTEYDEVKQKWKERLYPVETRVNCILNFFENGKEKKVVECVMVKNYDANKVEYWYEGKIVDHRPMTVADRQEDMPLNTRRGRSKENSVVMPTPTAQEEIADIVKAETSKKTKHSSVDGPTSHAEA